MSADSSIDSPIVSPDTIKISLATSETAIKISIPTVGAEGRMDQVVISIPAAVESRDIEVSRISGISGETIDTIKISGPTTGGG